MNRSSSLLLYTTRTASCISRTLVYFSQSSFPRQHPAATQLELGSKAHLENPAYRHSPTMPKPRRNIDAAVEETLTPPPTLAEGQQIARVKQGAGNNLYHLELPDGTPMLAELPAKFRSTVWMKRGGFVLVDTSALADRNNKLGGEIVTYVGDEREWRKMSWWPKEFPARKVDYGDDDESDSGPKMPPSDSEDE